MAIEPGQNLLHYHLVEKIGEGGMGVVWKAIDTTLDRPVAIKLLPASFADEPDRLARFEREAKLLAALNHPNIASIFSVHREEGEHFIALELVDGEDLAAGTAVGPLPLEDALQVCLSIAEALEAAHQAGVVHRDLKPANVKLSSDGKVKVLDFGLAKAVDPQTSSSGTSPTFAPTVTSAGTRAGVLLGTAAYMSPEQARGKPMDHRTDLWSFGCVLYECLTGHVLFAGETVSDTLAAILRKDPDWSRLPQETPANIRTLLKRCLARDPSRRLHSASDARIELLEAIENPGVEAAGPATMPAPAASHRWLPLGIAAMTLVAGLAIGWLLGTGGRSSSVGDTLHLGIPIPSSFRVIDPKLTPEGDRLVFAVWDVSERKPDRRSRLYMRRLDSDELELVEGSDGITAFDISPDGRTLAFTTRELDDRRPRLMLVPMDLSSPAQLLAEMDPDHRAILWIGDSSIGTINGRDWTLMQYPLSGGEPRIVQTRGEIAPYALHFREALPGLRHLLVQAVSFDTGVYLQNIATYDLETGELTHVLENASYARYLDSGHLVFSRADQLMLVRFDAETRRPIGAPRALLDGLWTEGGYTGGYFDVTPGGHLVYLLGGIQGGDRRIAIIDRDGALEFWSDERQQYETLHVAPNGKRFATMIDNTAAGDALLQVKVSDFETRRFTTIGARPGFDCTVPWWSPDSSRLSYWCQDQNVIQVFVANPDDGSSRMILERPLNDGLTTAGFLAGGTHMLGRVFREDGSVEVLSFPIDPPADGDGVETIEIEESDPRVIQLSHDGRWLMYFSRTTGRRELYFREVLGPTTLGPRRSPGIEVGDWATWAATGSRGGYEILYEADEIQYALRLRMDGSVTAGTPQRLPFPEIEYDVNTMDAMPDGRILGVIRPDSEFGSDGIRLILNWTRDLDRLLAD